MQEQLRDNFSGMKNENMAGIEIGENIFLDKEKNQITVFQNGSRIDFLYKEDELIFLGRENYNWDSGEKVLSDKELDKIKNKAFSDLTKFQSKNKIVTKEMITSAKRFEATEKKRSHGGFDNEDVILCE